MPGEAQVADGVVGHLLHCYLRRRRRPAGVVPHPEQAVRFPAATLESRLQRVARLGELEVDPAVGESAEFLIGELDQLIDRH
jgi:hypothetical protein